MKLNEAKSIVREFADGRKAEGGQDKYTEAMDALLAWHDAPPRLSREAVILVVMLVAAVYGIAAMVAGVCFGICGDAQASASWLFTSAIALGVSKVADR